MGKFISGIIAVIIVFFAGNMIVGAFLGSKTKGQAEALYFSVYKDKVNIEEYEDAKSPEEGRDVYFQFTTDEETLEEIIHHLELRRSEENIPLKTVMEDLYTLPDWFAPNLSNELIHIKYPDYYGMVLVESERTEEDELTGQMVNRTVYYLGAAGKHLKTN